MTRSQRVRAELRDLVELFLLPGCAALLPWPLCFRLFRLFSRWRWPYRAQCEQALAEAKARGWVADEAGWLSQRRLVTLVDHADFFLARTRSDRWMARHLTVEGRWPEGDRPRILCTFHWGAGMWGLRHARANGMRAHALVAPVRSEHYLGRRIAYHYTRMRNREVEAALGRRPLDVSGSLRPALKALKAREQVLAAVDVPADQVSASLSIGFLDARARVPRGLLRVAADGGVPVTVFLTGLDLRTGDRFLRIHSLPPGSEVDPLIREVFSYLESAVREEPVAWHFWAVAERFFERSPDSVQ